MTKIQIAALSIIMITTLAGCNNSDTPTSNTPTIGSTSAAEKAAAEKAAAEKAAAEKAAAEKAAAVANIRPVFATGEGRSFINLDDGATKRGLSHTYTKERNIVTDTTTKLLWQDDVTSPYKSWDEAISYCQSLTIDGVSDWRLPSMQELQTLIQFDHSPKISTTFSTRGGGKYWSSEVYPYTPESAAYYIDFSTGFSADYGDRSVFEKSNRYRVRCVKGDKYLLEGKFSRDNSKGIVIDSTTNLMWEDSSHINQTSSVEDAIAYCESLNIGGFNDWHLPNINELYTIADRSHYDDAVDSTFTHKLSISADNNNEHYRAANYWTSTYYGQHPTLPNVHYYRTFNERDGASHRCRYYMGMHTRCVRAVK
jgi:hypothetical protein